MPLFSPSSHTRIALTLCLCGGLLVGCGSSSSDQSTPSQSAAAQSSSDAASDTAASTPASTASPSTVPSVSVWQGAPVRDTPGRDGSWQTSLNVGETFTFLGETEETESGGQSREYSKVRLKGGSEGWVRSDFIANEATPAVLVREAALHERPTPMASTDKVFQPMDVVAIVKDEDGWLQVRGKRQAANWIESGWIRPDAVSKKETDVAVAALRTKAMEQDSPSAQRKALKRVVDNPSFQESVLIDSLRAQLDTLARADTASAS